MQSNQLMFYENLIELINVIKINQKSCDSDCMLLSKQTIHIEN